MSHPLTESRLIQHISNTVCRSNIAGFTMTRNIASCATSYHNNQTSIAAETRLRGIGMDSRAVLGGANRSLRPFGGKQSSPTRNASSELQDRRHGPAILPPHRELTVFLRRQLLLHPCGRRGTARRGPAHS